MPEMTDEEKAERLLFYKQQAQAQWDERGAELRALSEPFYMIERIRRDFALVLFAAIALGIVILGVVDHHYVGAFAFIVAAAFSAPLLHIITRADRYPESKSGWKPQLQSSVAFLSWLALYFAVAAISIADFSGASHPK